MNRAELAIATEEVELLERLAAAKAGNDRDELRAAKLAIREFREYHRTIREATEAGPGEARPSTLRGARARSRS